MSARIIVGDALSALRDLPDESVHCVVTSPPYWGLRSYGGDPGMIGLEDTFEEHLDNLVAVFREVRRVLRSDGTLWLNYGDAYADGRTGNRATEPAGPKQRTSAGTMDIPHRPVPPGLKPKDLMLMPTDVAKALQADGWWLRSMIPQIKSNPMPESVKDRPTNAVEYWFLLTKAPKYFYDQEAVKEPVSGTANARTAKHNSAASRKERANPDAAHTPTGERNGMRQRAVPPRHEEHEATNHRTLDDPKYDQRLRPPGVNPKSAPAGSGIKQNESFEAAMVEMPATRNMRNWVMAATAPFKGAHFATFAPHIVEPWIKAGTSEAGCCSECGAPWVRKTGKPQPAVGGASGNTVAKSPEDVGDPRDSGRGRGFPYQPTRRATEGFSPTCDCDAGESIPCTVLDPFAGSGTVGLVAERLGRDSVLIEINAEYADMARERIAADAPLLSSPELATAPEASIG